MDVESGDRPHRPLSWWRRLHSPPLGRRRKPTHTCTQHSTPLWLSESRETPSPSAGCAGRSIAESDPGAQAMRGVRRAALAPGRPGRWRRASERLCAQVPFPSQKPLLVASGPAVLAIPRRRGTIAVRTGHKRNQSSGPRSVSCSLFISYQLVQAGHIRPSHISSGVPTLIPTAQSVSVNVLVSSAGLRFIRQDMRIHATLWPTRSVHPGL